MFKNVLRGLCRNPGGVILVAGAIGVLTGVNHLMSRPAVGRTRVPPHPERQRVGMPKPGMPKPGLPKPIDRFTISRTQSELGYTYWVLQGYGQYTGFTLFDTWQEAMDEMQRRTKNTISVQELTVSSAAAV